MFDVRWFFVSRVRFVIRICGSLCFCCMPLCDLYCVCNGVYACVSHGVFRIVLLCIVIWRLCFVYVLLCMCDCCVFASMRGQCLYRCSRGVYACMVMCFTLRFRVMYVLVICCCFRRCVFVCVLVCCVMLSVSVFALFFVCFSLSHVVVCVVCVCVFYLRCLVLQCVCVCVCMCGCCVCVLCFMSLRDLRYYVCHFMLFLSCCVMSWYV